MSKSIIVFSPSKTVTSKGSDVFVDSKAQNMSPLDALRNNMPKVERATNGFACGALGYFSYDFMKNLESLPNGAEKTGFPDMEFGIYKDFIIFDHEGKSASYCYLEKNRLAKLKLCFSAKKKAHAITIGKIKPAESKDKFIKNILVAKKHILAGDIFQAVLSRRYEVDFEGSLLPFYKNLRESNPSPYTYFLKFGKRQIVGTSPEGLFSLRSGRIESDATIAGTRPRGRTKEQDANLERELLADEKDRAEHLMLLDLARNDIGKVAKPGSVAVSQFMKVKKYSHVQHIASRVSGLLKADCDSFSALAAMFPAGTVTGAPKIRAAQIIESLESQKRGPYAGAVGYFSANGDAEFAIAIRTLFALGKKAFVQAGAGIVYDSVPEKEYEETENKMAALIDALGGRL